MSELLHTVMADDSLEVRLRAAWRVDRIVEIERALQKLGEQRPNSVRIDTTELTALDLGPAALLRQWLQALAVPVEFTGTVPEPLRFVEGLYERRDLDARPAAEREPWLASVFRHVGERVIEQLREARQALGFFGRLAVTFLRALASIHRLRVPSIARHVYETGVLAIPIVSLIAFLISVIVAYLGAQQLQSFGAEIFAVDLVAIAVLRELGVLLTSIIVAGRSGSAFAAEIGVMRLNDEIDALQSMGMDEFEVLVAPRVIGLMIALPLLTIIADAMGLVGGGLLLAWLIDIPLEQFIARLEDALAPTTFWAGLIKAPVFAYIIALVGAYRGMQVRDSSRELGRLTTAAVVQSIFLVIFIDAVFAVVYVEIDF